MVARLSEFPKLKSLAFISVGVGHARADVSAATGGVGRHYLGQSDDSSRSGSPSRQLER